MRRARITGLGSYVPDNVVTNEDLTKIMETSDEWITQRTGIKERRWVANGESTSDLALIASERALAAAGLPKEKLDLIVFATLIPDHVFPGTGCFLQAKLGVPGIPAIDLRQQCTGFIYGLSVADQFIRSGMYSNVLVVGSEVHSKGLEKNTHGRDVTVLFGDGAGAVVVSAADIQDPITERCLLSTHLHSDGTYAKELWVPAPGSGFGPGDWISHAMLDEGLQWPKMNGKKVYAHAVKRMAEVLVEATEANGVKMEEIDLFMFHQANLRINEAVAEALQIPPQKIFNTIQKYGNTTAATIPLGMDDAAKAGLLKEGSLVASAAFGSGFTWASALFRY